LSPNPLLTEAVDRLAGGLALEADEASAVLHEIMAGRASEIQTAAFLVALRTKGETVPEVVGLARTMRSLAARVVVGGDDLVDTAGTGGGRPTFNVSTTAALVAAAAGCKVAKHGNRSATGQSGSADVLEALGARLDLEPAAVADCIASLGFGFMFAPSHHPAMKHVAPVRRALAVQTVFNFLGPLTNPAGATRQVIGVSDARRLDTIAAALGELGGRSALVLSSEDGLDEVSVSAPTRVVELSEGSIHAYAVTPEELGVERAAKDALRAGTPERNAEIVRTVMSGQPGAERSVTLLNAGAAIYVGGADSIADGVARAAEAIDSGAAAELLARWIERTQALAPAL
jgi:anthranilate phosphoribosyltransferase